ncbi:MAG: DUF6263 family protein [Gemmataceae bacterium]
MLRSRLISLLAVLFVALLSFGQEQDAAVDLKWKFEKDKPFYQELTTDTEQTLKVMNMDVNQKQKQTFYFSWTPVSQDEKDQSWTLKQKIIGIKMDINIGGNNISYDSISGPTAANPLAEFFKALIGSEFTVTLSPEGKVTNIEGQDAFLKKLIDANPQMKALLEQILNKQSMQQMADPLFAVVPGKEVKKGETWTRASQLSLGPIGGYDSSYTYTFDSLEKDLAKIGVKTTFKYVPPAADAGSGLPFRIKSAKLTGKEGTGTALFDIKTGQLQTADMSQVLEGTLDIEIGGMSTAVDLKQTQKSTTRITDTDPTVKKQ